MSSEYPDVLGDLVDARQRFEVNGVQYVMALDPPAIAPGETTSLRVWLQSCWDMPLQVALTLYLPVQPPAAFSIIQEQTDVPLEPAEVGELTIPIATSADLPPGEYLLSTRLGVQFETRGLYVRSQKSEGQLGDTLLSFHTGLALAATIGLGFVAHTQPEQDLSLPVAGEPQPGPAPDLTPTFVSHWTVADLPIQGKARRYVNEQRLHLQPQLTRQALYLSFLQESQERFRDAGLPLHIGEAIILAKVLTYSAEYFLKHPSRQDGVLVPAYILAYRYNLPVNDPVFLITRADYPRLVRLAISLSFGLLRQRLGRDVWTKVEQLAVADLVTDRVTQGGVLSAEFLYLPLLLGGILINNQVQMPGEDPAQSLKLLAQARQKRAADLAENPELTLLLDRLTQQA